jgi:hypothetical protein
VQARGAKAGVTVDIDGPNAKPFYYALEVRHKTALEQALGPLIWRELPEKKSSYIAAEHPFTIADRAVWPEVNAWLGDTLERFHAAFGPIVRSLSVDDAAGGGRLPDGDARPLDNQ